MSRDADRAILARSFLFSELSEREIDELISLAVWRRFDAEEVIVTRGTPSDRLFALLRGRVRVVRMSAAGNEIVLRMIDPGEVIGEIGVLDGGERSATAIASEPSELLVLQRNALLARLRNTPELYLKLLTALAGRLRDTDEQLADLAFLNVPPRLAKKLLSLAKSYGRPVEAGVRIELHLTQEALGNHVGTTRVSVSQQICAWRKRGLIEMKGGSVTLCDVAELERIAGADE
jgi:CRP-like cAMP-binding protein